MIAMQKYLREQEMVCKMLQNTETKPRGFCLRNKMAAAGLLPVYNSNNTMQTHCEINLSEEFAA